MAGKEWDRLKPAEGLLSCGAAGAGPTEANGDLTGQDWGKDAAVNAESS
jgi:hypothetical protein